MNRRQAIILGLFSLVTLIVFSVVFLKLSDTQQLTVSFLDVGQGDSIFIETPNGTQMLIDGGPNSGVLRELGKQMSFFDRSIDMVLVSHPDMDHVGGLPEVFDRFSVKHLLVSGVESDNGAYIKMMTLAKKENTDIRFARRGRIVLDAEHKVFLDILFPDREVTGLETNMSSVVMKLTYGKTSFLFTGDSPQAIEKYLISVDPKVLDVDVLKLAHHGSKTSNSEEFLLDTSPEYAIISAGKDNSYGHPHKEVLDLLNKDKIPYLDTMDVGTIVFESNGKSLVKK
jgi:competence protein ComEC